MAGLNHAITASFGISGKVIREKGSFRTADKRYLLQKTSDSPAKIWGYYQIKQHCKQKGYNWLDNQYLARDGSPFVQADGNYIMTDYIDAPELDFSAPEFLQAVEAVAHWHLCARGVSFDKFSPPAQGGCLIEEYEQALHNLETIRKKVRKMTKLSDFDVLFIKHFEENLNRIITARDRLKASRYAEYRGTAIKNFHICHGNLKEETLRKANAQYDMENRKQAPRTSISASEEFDRFYISKFSNARLDYQLKDLCELIMRHKKKGGLLPPKKIIAAYENRLPLQGGEEEILEAMLTYPGAFVKIAGEYYNKKRSWTPVYLMKGLTEILEERET